MSQKNLTIHSQW